MRFNIVDAHQKCVDAQVHSNQALAAHNRGRVDAVSPVAGSQPPAGHYGDVFSVTAPPTLSRLARDLESPAGVIPLPVTGRYPHYARLVAW